MEVKVFVLNHEGKPLMPVKPRKAGKLLKNGVCPVGTSENSVRLSLRRSPGSLLPGEEYAVSLSPVGTAETPFTIQLNYKTGGAVQDITIGIDAGYACTGFSAVTEKEELIGGEFKLSEGMSERIAGRRKYRVSRRSRLRHRKPGFLKDTKARGWFAPSIRHKLDSHLRPVDLLKELMPVMKIISEVANFDIQKIKNPAIEGKEYQNGHQAGWKNG